MKTFNKPMSLLLLGMLNPWPVNSVLNGILSTKVDFFVAITRDRCDPTLHCGGALIARDMVLTAAHCFDGLQSNPDGFPDSYPDTAWVGRQAFPCGTQINTDTLDIGKSFDLDRIFLPFGYDVNDPFNENDIAIVRLAEMQDTSCPERGIFSENNVLASFQNTLANSTTGLNLYGFGRIVSFQDVSEVLRFGATDYDPSQPCSSQSVGYNSAVHICTEKAISCQGDSGGPLVQYDNNAGSWSSIVGIASYMDEYFGEYCGGQDIYTRVSNYEPLILEVLCTESAYPPSNCKTANLRAEHAWISRDLPKPPAANQRMAWRLAHLISRTGSYFSTAGSYIFGDWFF